MLTTGCPHFLRPVVVGGGRVVWGCGGGAGGGGGGAQARPVAVRVARRSGPAPAMAPFPLPGRSSLWTASFCWGWWLVLLRGCDACRAVGGGLQSEAALIDVLLDVGSLPPRSSWPTVAGCRLGGFSVGRVRAALRSQTQASSSPFAGGTAMAGRAAKGRSPQVPQRF